MECAKEPLDLERGVNMNNAAAFGLAAYAGTPELCEVLITAGVSRMHVQFSGGTKLHDACQNVATTKPMLENIWSNGELDINAVQQPRTVFFRLVFSYFQMGMKCGLITKSQFVMDMAYAAGNTPLHYSAMHGLIDVTEWLLQHGAHKSLRIRNQIGATPLDVARIFGPYPAVEAKLGAAMLNHQFDTQFAIRRGSLLRKQAGGAIEPEDGGDDTPSPGESRPAEPTFVQPIKNDESVRTGDDATTVEQGDVGTHTLPPVVTSGNVETPTIDSSTATDLGNVDTRFDEQASVQAKIEQIMRHASTSKPHAPTSKPHSPPV